jgi:redox-sensitive bicupin YhaK (pirin superfamily)
MITRIPANKRYLAAHGWLNSFHLFSFADYYDPENMSFGPLRVFNDDFIVGESGFGEHPHNNMEIITIMREGTLTHRDSMGNEATITAGEVQCMTAGTGVEHAEVNKGKTPVRLSQIWIMPKEKGLVPSYGQKDFSGMKKNVLVPVASGESKGDALSINAPATIYLGEFESGEAFQYSMESGHGVFMYATEGAFSINGEAFNKGDQARITDESKLFLNPSAGAKCVFIDVLLS